MSDVQQSGSVTPGHLAQWVTSGVLADAGPLNTSQKVLASIRGADFNSTADQPILIPAPITAFQLAGIIVTNASVSLTTAVGGIYTAASKGGSQLVANSQVYSSLTAPTKLLQATLTSTANTSRFSSANLTFTVIFGLPYLTLYFSLTTPQGATATADIYLVGLDLS